MLLGSGLILILAIALFLFAEYKKQNLETPLEVVEPTVIETDPYVDIETVDAKHYYIDGVHTLVGEVNMPTPCDLLRQEVSVAESFPEQIFIDFIAINNSDACAQVITPQRFKLSAPASSEATFHAHFNDRDLNLNIIPAAEGETPEEFEVFIKG